MRADADRSTGRSGEDLGRRIRALGAGGAAPDRVRARVEIQLATMLRRFGLDPVRERERSRLELMAAEVRCARCADTARCRSFLLGDADDPELFCPNAVPFARLAPPRPRVPWWRRLLRRRA